MCDGKIKMDYPRNQGSNSSYDLSKQWGGGDFGCREADVEPCVLPEFIWWCLRGRTSPPELVRVVVEADPDVTSRTSQSNR